MTQHDRLAAQSAADAAELARIIERDALMERLAYRLAGYGVAAAVLWALAHLTFSG